MATNCRTWLESVDFRGPLENRQQTQKKNRQDIIIRGDSCKLRTLLWCEVGRGGASEELCSGMGTESIKVPPARLQQEGTLPQVYLTFILLLSLAPPQWVDGSRLWGHHHPARRSPRYNVIVGCSVSL